MPVPVLMPDPMHKPLHCLLTVFALMFFLAFEMQAQSTHRIGFGVGSAAPVGDFKKDRFEDEYPPMARRGVNWQLTYRTDLKPYLAVGATAGYRSHRFDLDAFAAPDDVLVLRREASGWRSSYALADLYLQSAPANLFGYVKGSVGAANNKSPEVQVDTPFGPIRRSSDTAVALAYGIASGFGVQDGRFLLTVDIGVLRTRPTFDVTNAQGDKTTIKQSMHIITSMVGLSYTLQKMKSE
jgi:hypothetical protein